eukprot:844370-Karenia_brevis.AAC.1
MAAGEQQAGNWLADHFAYEGALECQLTDSEVQPIIKKDRVRWHSRMIAVVQTMPTRAKIPKDQLVVTQPSAREELDELEHQISAKRGTLACQRCGQMWKDRRQIGGE